MSDPDPATTAFLASLVGDRDLEPGEWFSACLADAHEALEAARPLIEAAERQRIRPLLLALHHLYDVVWHQIGTVDLSHVAPGYNGISYDDDNAIDAAAQPVDALLATGQFADLLDGDRDA